MISTAEATVASPMFSFPLITWWMSMYCWWSSHLAESLVLAGPSETMAKTLSPSIAYFPGCLVAIDPLPDWLIDWAGSTQSLLSSSARAVGLGHVCLICKSIRCVRSTCQPTSQQYCSLILNQHQPSATSQSAVLLSHNKSAPAISHSPANTAIIFKIH